MSSQRREKNLIFPLVFVLIFCFLMSGKVFAQTLVVTLDGVVTDEEGSALSDVKITVRNVETGYVMNIITRSDGRYIISGIQPGKYEVQVSLPGFDTQIRRGLTFSVGARLTIDFTLTLQTIEEEIEVVAEAPMVEVTKSEISTVVGRQKIDDLPLIDRDFEDLTFLKAGVQKGRQMGEGGGSHYSGFRTNAMPRGYGEMYIDGVSNEMTHYGTIRSGTPVDAIQEFRVITNQFAAEYGSVSGLLRSVITRSGTNDFKGRVSFFYRDEALDDVNYFVNHTEYKGEELPEDQWGKAAYNFYRFGGLFGGPIKKDKAHFFIAYDGVRSTTYTTITSPLVERETLEIPKNRNSLLVKLNYQPSVNHIISTRYGLNYNTLENYGVGGLNTMDRIRDEWDTRHDFQFNWTFFVSDKSMNEFRFLFGYTNAHSKIPEKWTVSEFLKKPDAYSITRPSGRFGPSGGDPMFEKTHRYQIVDNFSVFLGDHSLKFGVDVSRTPWHNAQPSGIPGGFSFDTDEPFDPDDPTTYPYRFSYNVGNPDIIFNYSTIAAFAQDSWRIHPQLTLNFGVRYTSVYSEGIHLAKWDIRNFNPRFGFSWDPVGDGKTSVRGGIGTYTANPTANVAGYTIFIQTMSSKSIVFPNYPDPFQPNPFFPAEPGVVSETVFDAKENQIAPYTLQTTLGFQREILPNFSVAADVVWAKGYRLMYQTQSNPVIPGTYFVRVDPSIGNHYTVVDWGRSDYKALLLTVSKRFSEGWALDIAYTLSKSMSDTESEFSRPADPYNDPEKLRMYGPAVMDARHRLAVMSILELPLGFQWSALFYYVSKTPWNALYLSDVNQDGSRSDYVDEYQNSRRGFAEYYINTRISKSITIDRFAIRIFAEGFNITNRVNFTSIYSRTPHPFFGKPQAAGSPRQIQFGIRLDW